jgi:hypothetical protein
LIGGCNSQNVEAPLSAKGAKSHAHDMPGVVPLAHHTKLSFTSTPSTLHAGQSARWTLQINDAQSGRPVEKFEIQHTKLMHLIVASRNLSWLVHIHPRFQGAGKFVIDYAMPRAGAFRLYADYSTPTGGHEVALHDITVEGDNPLTSRPALTVDTLKNMWITKTFRAHDEGRDPAPGAPSYQVALMPMPGVLRAGEAAMLHFQVRDAKGKPLADLQPYLGAMGHAVILSSDGKTYLHTHPMEGDMAAMMDDEGMHHAPQPSGSDVVFHTTFPRPGLYRVWGEFMHGGKIITADYTLLVLPAVPNP